MTILSRKSAIVSAINKHHSEMVKNGESWTEWRKTPKRFTRREADEFFVGVLFDRQQDADRAWDAGRHLVGNHFQGGDADDFWVTVSQTSISKVKKVMSSGFGRTGVQGASKRRWTGPYHRHHNDSAKYLKRNAEIILDQYSGDVRNIWKRVSSNNVDLIYDRFLSFIGIGHALARMAQFILVRDYGIAGGPKSKRFMRVKPDVHVCRVAERLGLVSQGTPRVVVRELDALGLESQADVDLVLFRVGQEYCHRTPNCGACPLRGTCARRGVS